MKSCRTKSIAAFFTLASISAMLFFVPVDVMAGSNDLLGVEYGKFSGLGERDVREGTASIIQVLLSLLGMVALVVILYAGFTWMTAGGNEEKVMKARKILFTAVIGLAIILTAYALTTFVFSSLFKATTGFDYVTI